MITQIIKNLSSRKPLIIISLFCTISLILLGIAVINISQVNGKTDALEELSQEDQTYLNSLYDSLDKLDHAVVSNQEGLTGINLFNSETSDSLTGISDHLKSLEQMTETVGNTLDRYNLVSQKDQVTLTESFSSLYEYQQVMESQITESQELITEILSSITDSNQQYYSETMEKISFLQTYLENTKSTMKEYYADILTQTDEIKTIMENQSLEFSTELTTSREELLAALLETGTILQAALDEQSLTLQVTLQENYLSLMEQMDFLHQQLTAAKTDLSDIMAVSEENAQARHEESQNAIQAISEKLIQFNQYYDNTQLKLQELIHELETVGNGNHAEALTYLNSMEQNLNSASDQHLNRIMNSMTDLQSFIDQSFSSINTDMIQQFSSLETSVLGELNLLNNSIDQGITEQLDQLNTSITNQYNDLSSSVTNYGSGQQQNYDSLLNTITEELSKVFQSVSSGKQKLASALLTKGITITEDATFDEIQQAILDIAQQLLIGVEQIPGKISYDYHYHSGNSSANGGCYTTPVYHVHSSSCNRNQRCSCGGFSGNQHIDTSCERCGHHYDFHWPLNHDTGQYEPGPCGITTSVISCGKNNSTLEGYSRGCGLNDGQIIGAHIVYAESALPEQNSISSFSAAPPAEETLTDTGEEVPESILEHTQENIPDQEDGSLSEIAEDGTEDGEVNEITEDETEDGGGNMSEEIPDNVPSVSDNSIN